MDLASPAVSGTSVYANWLIFQIKTRNILYTRETGCLWSYTMDNVHYLLTYILTYSMEQSPSWEANQEIPCILRNPKIHCRIYKCPPLVPVLSQINLIPASHSTSWDPS